MTTQIKFSEARVLNFILSNGCEATEDDFKLAFYPAFNETDLREFLIVFEIEIVSSASIDQDSDKVSMQIQYAAKFETSEDIDKAFMESPFVEKNAPAIAYPYLRAFVSNFTINAGLKPLVLDTVNFFNGFDKRKIDEKDSQ